MDTNPRHPSVPAEALARQARLSALLARMEQSGASREPMALQALHRALRGERADPAELVRTLVEADLVEEGASLIRSDRRNADAETIRQITVLLAPLAAKAQHRREATWQLDGRRTCVRVGYGKARGAVDLDEGDVHAIFLQAFRLEGFRLALDLGKRPRPSLRLELPLPAGVGGACEWVEVVLRTEPAGSTETLMASLNGRLPEGLRIHRWEAHPSYASALGDLAEASHWRWACPAHLVDAARQRTDAFLASSEWLWEKEGRVEGRKQVKPLDLRPLVMELRWEDAVLVSTTRTRSSESGNPLKIHAAILGLEPAALHGLMRQALDLNPDPRLARAERFEPKLKNMYEDAVLLGGGSNITLVDEDDDEPIQLG